MKDYIVTIECFVKCKDGESEFDAAIKLIKNDEKKYFQWKSITENPKRKCYICGGMGWRLTAAKLDECSNCGAYYDILTGSEYVPDEYLPKLIKEEEQWLKKEGYIKNSSGNWHKPNDNKETKQNKEIDSNDDDLLAELDRL